MNIIKRYAFKFPITQLIDNGEINLNFFYRFFLKNKSLLKRIILNSIIISFILFLFTTPKYTSSFTIMNSSDSEMPTTSSGGLISQLYGGESTFQYSHLMNSKSFLMLIVNHEHTINSEKTNLIDFFQLSESLNPMNLFYKWTLTENDYLKYLEIKAMDKIIDAATFSDTDDGLFVFSIALKEPSASFEIANKIINEMNQFSINNIQQSAFQKRLYLEKRVDNINVDILKSEIKLQEFLNINKNFNDSPKLLLDYNRLKTNVDLNYQVKSQLIVEIEILKASELKDNSQLIILDAPNESILRSNTLVQLMIEYFFIILTLFIMIGFYLNFYFKR